MAGTPGAKFPVEIVLLNRPEERQRLMTAFAAFASEQHVPAKASQAAELALEEHITNIINYAYADAARHEIWVRVECVAGALVIEVEDDGRAFNPLETPPPDISQPLEQRPVGGLGIHLIRQFMDELLYRRENGRNILRMRKRLES